MAVPLYTSDSINNLIGYTYANNLGEVPDQAGIDYWTNALQSGQVDMDSFNQSFTDYARANNKTLLSDISLVNNVFTNGLGRNATQEESDFWTNEIASGNVNSSTLVDAMAENYGAEGINIDTNAVKQAVKDDYNSQMLGYDVTLADPFSFEQIDFTTSDPSYQFRLQEGIDALDASAASRGMVQSGAQQQAITDYAQNYASQEYSNAYNRAAETYDRQQNAMLNVANLGVGAGASITDSTNTLGTTTSNNLINTGNALASGITNSANITTDALENVLLANNLNK